MVQGITLEQLVIQKVFDDFFREIALPKITNLEIKKSKMILIFTLQLNLDEIISRNVKR